MKGLITAIALTVLGCGASHAQTEISRSGSGWQVYSTPSPVDDSATVLLQLASEEPFLDRFGRKKWGKLSISCQENSTNLAIWVGGDFMTATDPFGYVTLRIDRQKAQRVRMSESTDHQFLGLWRGQGINLIKKIAQGKTLFVRATPYNEAPVDLIFRVAGLPEVLPQVQKACGWK